MSKLFSTTRIPQGLGRFAHPSLRRFAKHDDGMITIFGCFVLIMMLMIAGIGIDLMRHEMERVRIQHTADRAVLAAADLDQTLDPKAVVVDYFEKAELAHLAGEVTVDEGLNYRTVSVNADGVMPTTFMNMVGIEELPLRSRAAAEEKVNKVEISLVLDISGSMSSGDKMPNLRAAAKTFVDTVLKPETRDLVSISLIPYSEHVSAGENIIQHLNVTYNNPYTHCVEFSESDFATTTMRQDKTYTQVQHFQWGFNGYDNDVSTPVCPNGASEDITPFSQDITTLNAQIDNLVPRGSTSIFAGMKWAAGLLDPDFNVITKKLATAGQVDGVFDVRPAAWADSETLKTVILMTDGQNHYSYRINNNYYQNYSHAAHWNRYNLHWYLQNHVHPYYHNNFRYLKYTPDIGNQLLASICNAAKDSKIVIWSIGFEVTDYGANVMKNCASSPSHFFRVEGVEITQAFKSIARQINQLRLTQ